MERVVPLSPVVPMDPTPPELDAALLPQLISQSPLSMAAIAEMLNVTPQALGLLIDRDKKGNISLAALSYFAKAFGYRLEVRLYSRTPDKPDFRRTIQVAGSYVDHNTRKQVMLRDYRSLDESVRVEAPTRIDELEITPSTLNVSYQGQTIRLTPRELMILKTVLLSREPYLHHDALLKAAWGEQGSSRASLRVILCKLRAKLAKIDYPKTILSIGHKGFAIGDRPPQRHRRRSGIAD